MKVKRIHNLYRTCRMFTRFWPGLTRRPPVVVMCQSCARRDAATRSTCAKAARNRSSSSTSTRFQKLGRLTQSGISVCIDDTIIDCSSPSSNVYGSEMRIRATYFGPCYKLRYFTRCYQHNGHKYQSCGCGFQWRILT